MSLITQLAKQTKEAARALAVVSEEKKNTVLSDMAAALRAHKQEIISINEQEVA